MLVLKAIVTAISSVIAMFLISKILGNKQISELNLFDYINGITIGSIAAELAISDQLDEFIIALVALIIYGLTGFILSVSIIKSIKCRKLFTGIPIMLIEKGKMYPENLKTAKLDIEDLLSRARNEGYFNVSDIQYAILESNGKISFMPTVETAPITPELLGVNCVNDEICPNVILDGVVMEKNLKQAGVEIKWLTKQLKYQGYSSPSDVFLATMDKDKKLTIYPQSTDENKKDPFN